MNTDFIIHEPSAVYHEQSRTGKYLSSGRGLVTSYSGEFGEILCGFCRIIQLNIFNHRQGRCKKQHILPPQAATSQVKR